MSGKPLQEVCALTTLHEHFVDPHFSFEFRPLDDDFILHVKQEAEVYAEWFPKETQVEFQRAYEELRKQGRKPSDVLVALEELYFGSAPKPNKISSQDPMPVAHLDERSRNTFLAKHSYRNFFVVADHLRPTGKGYEAVFIDFFSDREINGHTASVIDAHGPRWATKRNGEHGRVVASMAVGKELGLAPDVHPWIAPVSNTPLVEFPQQLLSILRKVLELKQEGHPIAAIGMSLALEVPYTYGPVIGASPLFRELEEIFQKLQGEDIDVVMAAGNDGEYLHVNLYGLFSGVILVGGMENAGTTDQQDDRVWAQSTGRCVFGAEMCALATITFPYVKKGKTMWIPQQGTSLAAPLVLGTLLLLRQVNPSLNQAERLRILRETSYPIREKLGMSTAINPMEAVVRAAHLPGSIYNEEDRAVLARELFVDRGNIQESTVAETTVSWRYPHLPPMK